MSSGNKNVSKSDVTKYLVLCVILLIAGMVFLILMLMSPVFSAPLLLFSTLGIALGAFGVGMYFVNPKVLYNLFHSKEHKLKNVALKDASDYGVLDCPSCGKAINANFNLCPHCRTQLRA